MKSVHKTSALLLSSALCAALLCGCGSKPSERFTATGFYFDTVVTMSVYARDDSVLDEALSLCADYEALLSKTVEGSDIWRINHACGEWTEVSPETASLLNQSISWAKATDGAFDVTIAPVMALWDFTAEAPSLPDESALMAAAELVDYTALETDGNRVRLPEGMSIDLGGIAKGYISARVRDRLCELGVTEGLLNFGGNVVVIGGKPDGEPWKVGIQNPFELTGTPLFAIAVTDSAVVTSGNYERFFELDGLRYHHIIDARTGYPMQNGVAGVTVICPDATEADALSTSCFLLGPEDGLELIASLDGVEAVYIMSDGEVLTSPGLEGKLIYSN
ncbi:MAG: FAD:protein FMN transferase [Oscillospiraceae bacterium]